MALNEIYKDGNELVFPVASTVESGDLVTVGTMFGVAQNDAVLGEDGDYYATLKLNGVFKFVTTEDDIAVGANVYVSFAGVVSTTATKGKFIGHCIKSGTNYAVVRLVQNSAAAATE